MENTNYQSAAKKVVSLGSIVPKKLVEETTTALSKLDDALCGDVSGYVAKRLHMSIEELGNALAAEQVDGVALAMYNIEKRAQSIIIGDQTGIGKGRQAAAMIRYGILSGYLPIFFTDRYTLFSDMYRDCKALGIKDARPLVVNNGVSVVDFDHVVKDVADEKEDELWSPTDDEDEEYDKRDAEIMELYQKQYEIVYKAPTKKNLQQIFNSGNISTNAYDYLMITYSQLKDAKRDITRLDFLHSLCEKHRVLFIFDEAHRSSSVSAGKPSVITQGINRILKETPQTQCIFLSATFAKRPESFITFMRRTALSALATDHTLGAALHNGGIPMQEYVSSCLAAEGQMIRREHSSAGLPDPIYTYLDDDFVVHGELFDKVMFYFREIVQLSGMIAALINAASTLEPPIALDFDLYPTRAQLFYINKILLLSLKAQKVAQVAVDEVKQGRCVVIGMSDTLECILRDIIVLNDDAVRGDISALLLRLLEKTIHGRGGTNLTISDIVMQHVDGLTPKDAKLLTDMANAIEDRYKEIADNIRNEVFHLPISPIDVIRQLITREQFAAPDGSMINIRFEECTGRAHQLEYLSPEGDDDFINARITPRKKRHSNHIFNDFQNNKIDVILINSCGAIGASAHAISTAEVPDEQVRQRKMLIVQNDLDVNIDLQKRGRINRTGQRADLPPLYEYIITAIPSEKRLNMMLRAKLRSLSANTAAWQDQEKDQADFVDINNKYGNTVAHDYLNENIDLRDLLGLDGSITASMLLARIAMLSVSAQQDIVDDVISAYISLEAELRRINQWDLERDFRDFEAEFVREELFTTAKADTKFGGCSYLTTYRCKQKTFPYSWDDLTRYCDEAKERFGPPYILNPELNKEVKKYYSNHAKRIYKQFAERRSLLHDATKRTLVGYCQDDSLAESWLEKACKPYDKWAPSPFNDINGKNKDKITRKLISFSNEYNHLIDREKKEVKKYAAEKQRLTTALSKAEIGLGYDNIRYQLADEDCPDRVIAVLRDIRFGKDPSNRFLPSKVEFVFALTAVETEIRINLVHNNKWSNYDRLIEILNSKTWQNDGYTWDHEIAMNNQKTTERKIITGNILGAYVHPAISELKPRFISFSLNGDKDGGKPQTEIGLLLPMDEVKIRESLKNVTIPLNEGLKYANNTNASYTIAGMGVDFSLLPCRTDDSAINYVVSVADKHSRQFETDTRFDSIRQYFSGNAVTSIYSQDVPDKKKRKPLMHYHTKLLSFESEAFQTIIQSLSQMDAVIIVPREQLTYGEVKEFSSRSAIDNKAPWAKLNWKDNEEAQMPPIKENLLLRISSPIVPTKQKGRAVQKHSTHYDLAKETMALNGLSLKLRSTIDALRRIYIKWHDYHTFFSSYQYEKQSRQPAMFQLRKILNEIEQIVGNSKKATNVVFGRDASKILQDILDSEYIDPTTELMERFDNEMLFQAPDLPTAQAFLDEMPCSPKYDGIRKSIQDYIEGETEIINSPKTYML